MFDVHVHLKDGCPPDVPAGGAVALASVDESEWGAVAAARRPGVLAACGIHPLWVAQATSGWQERLAALAPQLDAIGEAGLDFSESRTPDEVELQTSALQAQIEIAARHGLPIVLHVRRAWDVFFKTVTSPLNGVVHNFTGSADVALNCLKLGLHLSFSTAVFNKNADRLRLTLANLPADRILVDTDWPYRNGDIAAISAKVAQIRGIPIDELAKNAELLFNSRVIADDASPQS